MNKTVLIQRLRAPLPQNKTDAAVVNPFAFGGGGGRLSKQALDLLLPIFDFDYMGSAEFEWGEVPAGLQKIRDFAVNGNLFFSTLTIQRRDVVERGWGSKTDKARTWDSCPVYVVGALSDQVEVEDRVTKIAIDEDAARRSNKNLRDQRDPVLWVREPVGLGTFIQFEPTYRGIPLGWLELDNGFFFSVDKEMAEKFYALFTPTDGM